MKQPEVVKSLVELDAKRGKYPRGEFTFEPSFCFFLATREGGLDWDNETNEYGSMGCTVQVQITAKTIELYFGDWDYHTVGNLTIGLNETLDGATLKTECVRLDLLRPKTPRGDPLRAQTLANNFKWEWMPEEILFKLLVDCANQAKFEQYIALATS